MEEKYIYLYDKLSKELRPVPTSQMVAVPEEEVYELLKKHSVDMEKNYGYLTVDENDKIIFKDYMVKMLVHKDMYYFMETHDDQNDDTFYTVELPRKEYAEYDNIRSTRGMYNDNVFYYDGKFHVHNIPHGYKFNFETKSVEKDIDLELSGLVFAADMDNMVNIVKYNGFPFEYKGKTYLQPFRGIEDRSYYSSLKNDVKDYNREIKLFIPNEQGKRNSSNFDMIRGPEITNEWLEEMILKIIRYENAVKPAVAEYRRTLDEAIANKDVEMVKQLSSNAYKEVIRELTEEVNGMNKR